MYNFKEATLKPDFATEKLADFKERIEDGRSFVVLSMPGVGVSYFLRYSVTQDFAKFFHIDLYSLPILNQDEFYKLLKSELGGREVKTTLKALSEKESRKIVLIFSRFDQLKKEFDNQFLSNIQSLATISPGKIVLIFTSVKPLPEISKEPLTGGNLNFYSEELYFKPYSKEDLKKLITIEPPRITPKDDLEKLIDLSGGHFQLLQILRRSQKQQNLLLDQFVKLQLKQLLDYLDYSQRKQLQKMTGKASHPGLDPGSIDEYLLGIGMIKKLTPGVKKMRLHLGGVEFEPFTPLLSEYIKLNLPVKLPVKETKLFKLLRKNIGNVVSKDEIFTEVWPENSEEVSDWALDALIYRLRKHPFIKSGGYIIESHKKVGYTLIQA